MTTKKTPPDGSPSKAKELIAAPAAKAKREPKKRGPKVPPKIAKACELLSSGEAKTIVEAAKLAGIHRVTLGRRLAEPEVRAYMLGMARLDLITAAPYAAKVRLDLLRGAKSEAIRSESATEVLGLAGIQVPRAAPSVAVQVNVGSAGYTMHDDVEIDEEAVRQVLRGPGGYILDLRTQRHDRTAVDVEPWQEAVKPA